MTTRTPQSPSTFTIWSVKAQETFTGTGGEAIARAKEKAYALKSRIDNRCEFGWEADMARLAFCWAWGEASQDGNATVPPGFVAALHRGGRESIVKNYFLTPAHWETTREAAWTLPMEDVSRYYGGPKTRDEDQIRHWVEVMPHPLGVRQALLEMLVQEDRRLLADPGLVRQIARQLDEDG